MPNPPTPYSKGPLSEAYAEATPTHNLIKVVIVIRAKITIIIISLFFI